MNFSGSIQKNFDPDYHVIELARVKITDQKKIFKSGQIYMKDGQWAETNEKSIFRFLLFEL